MKDLKSGNLSYATVGEFLADLKEEFGGEYNEMIKVVELKKVEQEGKIIEKFVHKFRRVARDRGYKERLLVLWQQLDQCPIAALQVNLKADI